MIKVHVVGANYIIQKMFLEKGWEVIPHLNFNKEIDLIVFPGGADVTPSMYGQEPHPSTNFHSKRDMAWKGIYEEATHLGIPISGICKGSQFCVVMNGGSLFQDVDGHATASSHPIADLETGEEYEVSSTHHQQFKDEGEEGELIAIASMIRTTRKLWMDEDNEVDSQNDEKYQKDKEVIYYPKTNTLATQFHPEFCPEKSGCREYYFKLLKDKLGIGE